MTVQAKVFLVQNKKCFKRQVSYVSKSNIYVFTIVKNIQFDILKKFSAVVTEALFQIELLLNGQYYAVKITFLVQVNNRLFISQIH